MITTPNHQRPTLAAFQAALIDFQAKEDPHQDPCGHDRPVLDALEDLQRSCRCNPEGPGYIQEDDETLTRCWEEFRACHRQWLKTYNQHVLTTAEEN